MQVNKGPNPNAPCWTEGHILTVISYSGAEGQGKTENLTFRDVRGAWGYVYEFMSRKLQLDSVFLCV